MTKSVRFDRELIQRYEIAAPRYTSYPTAPNFHEGFDAETYRRHISISNDELIPAPLSLYVHLPFCRSLCFYCACTKKVTRHAAHGTGYLDRLAWEIREQGRLFDDDRNVSQLHFGGGTPTYFDDFQLESLMTQLRDAFSLDTGDGREFSIEIDPRTVSPDRLETLAGIGFNRMSLGLQDNDPRVQEAVNRVQDTDAALALIDTGRHLGFESISVDLIQGLPLQTPESFGRTIEAVLQARPDRLAVYSYAHLPNRFRAQRLIRDEDLPSAETRLALMELTVERLTGAGYRYIGMDHFALPGDELARALDSGTLHRNFQGYSTRRECDLVGLGVSAIGKVGDCYAQNMRELPRWGEAVDHGRLPVWRGVSLTAEDRLRRSVIEAIMCGGRIRSEDFERQFDIQFDEFFAAELESLRAHADDGLIAFSEEGFDVLPAGRLLLRAIAMAFDAYLQPTNADARYSRVI